jgi:hypothetical protein
VAPPLNLSLSLSKSPYPDSATVTSSLDLDQAVTSSLGSSTSIVCSPPAEKTTLLETKSHHIPPLLRALHGSHRPLSTVSPPHPRFCLREFNQPSTENTQDGREVWLQQQSTCLVRGGPEFKSYYSQKKSQAPVSHIYNPSSLGD